LETSSIPQDLKSDHLFLLIGTNPLPNWVAACLLLNEDGIIYPVFSKGTRDVEKKLTDFLIENGLKQSKIDPIELADEADPGQIASQVGKKTKSITSGRIGLNYTGGTKVMAVHAHRAVVNNIATGMESPVFSYLDARRLEMVFDPSPLSNQKEKYDVSLDPACKMDLVQLFHLHGETLEKDKAGIECKPVGPEVKARPVVDALVELHRSFRGFSEWRNYRAQNFKCFHDQRYSKQNLPAYIIKEQEEKLKDIGLVASGELLKVTQVLMGKSELPVKIGDVFQEWGFSSAKELVHFLDGLWLENYVMDCLQKIQTRVQLHECNMNIKTQTQTPFIMPNGMKSIFRGYEVDVVALRGYQLFYVSCYAGENKATAKEHLFEAYVRARQLGGDEARIALVCCYSNPLVIEAEVFQDWDTEGKIRVFGLNHLPRLASELEQWFSQR
jgi:hypothetical protein